MKRKKILNICIIFSILLLLFSIIKPTANAQLTYFGSFGPYFTPPISYGYAFNPFLLPPAPVPFLATYRNASVFTPVLPALTTTAPSVTPAGLSITSLIPPAPVGAITIVLPITPLSTLAAATIVAPSVVAPTVIAPTVINPTFLTTPLAATSVPGLTTAILSSFGPSGGGSWSLIATLATGPII